MDKTVWKNSERKWTPRNKQAALIFTKAKPFHLPIPKPIFAERPADRLKREAKERDQRIKVIDEELRIKKEESERKQAEERKRVWQRKRKRFHKNQTNKMNRLAKKIAAKLAIAQPKKGAGDE